MPQILRLDSWRTSDWVKKAFEKRTCRLIPDGSSQSGYGVNRIGNSVQKTLAQLRDVKNVHAHMMMMETENNFQLFKTNTVMDMYAKCGSMVDARYVFDNMPKRDVVSWNVMILGYAKQEDSALALGLYARMGQERVQPSARTFVGTLKACSGLAALEKGKPGCLEKGRAIHCDVLENGFESDLYVGNTLVDMYAKCGSTGDARHVFDALPRRDVVSWNAMVSGYAKQEEAMLALELFMQMHQESVQPNAQTFVCALKACTSLVALDEGNRNDQNPVEIECLEKGRAIHSELLIYDFDLDKFVRNTLVDMYTKCGSMEDACHVFNVLPRCDVVSWTAMILGFVKQEEGVLALEFFTRMHQEDVQPDAGAFICALKACSTVAIKGEARGGEGKALKVRCLEKGRVIHSQVLKNGFVSDIFVGTKLVDLYAKCGSMEDARHVFDELSQHDVVSWNAMIFGYAEKEESEEALKLYAQMQERGLSADVLTFIGTLKACGGIAALETGKQIHDQIRRVRLETTTTLATALIDMYAKCGSMDEAQQLFDVFPTRDVLTWSALLAGYAHQGESELLFHMFERMIQEGIQPDRVAFLSILTVCNHVGLVDKGQDYFQAMTKEYGIIPALEHYNCMVDLLGRAGHVDEAVAIVEKMPFEPDVVVWVTVLGACQKWKDVEVGRRAFQAALSLDKKCATAYVLMSNIYAQAHMWYDHNKIQVMRKDAGAWTELVD